MNKAAGMVGTLIGIQYLRALAALLVVIHHTTFQPVLKLSTHLGPQDIDIFFVISGFVLAYATADFGASPDYLAKVGGFMYRRFIRVVPLYWCFAALWLLLYRRFDLLPAALRDFVFWPAFSVFLPQEIWPNLIPGWTVNYEVFFYLVFGLSMLFGRHRLLVATASLSAMVLAGECWEPHSAPGRFFTDSIVLDFTLGFAVHRALTRMPIPRAPVLMPLLVLGCMLLILQPWPELPRFIAKGLPSALILYAFVPLMQGTRNRPLEVVGAASYSVYLSHMFSFHLSAPICRFLALGDAGWLGVGAGLLIYLVIALACGLLVHLWLERPLIAVFKALGPRRATAARTLDGQQPA